MKSILLTLVVVSCGAASMLAAQTQTAPPASAPPHAPANAPSAAPAATPIQRSAAQLEKLVEPIALRPDPLIAIILPASVYPLEIVQAARFVRDTNNIPKVDHQSWDDNVKEVAKFPELIVKMDADLPWTLVRTTQGWCFDTKAGREEIPNRRIGRNELEVLEGIRMHVDAQREYASKDYGGHGVVEYAQRIASSPGQTDGLYWSPDLNGVI